MIEYHPVIKNLEKISDKLFNILSDTVGYRYSENSLFYDTLEKHYKTENIYKNKDTILEKIEKVIKNYQQPSLEYVHILPDMMVFELFEHIEYQVFPAFKDFLKKSKFHSVEGILEFYLIVKRLYNLRKRIFKEVCKVNERRTRRSKRTRRKNGNRNNRMV